MPDFTDAQGNVIAPTDLAAKVASGEAFGDSAAEYSMRDQAGQIVKVRGADVPKALGGGMSILSPEQAAFESRRGELEGQGLRTMAERAVSSASFGLSDVAARQFAPGMADDMAMRAQANPGMATMGTVAGAAVPFSIGGRVAKGVEGLIGAEKATTAFGRMSARAAAGATAGGLDGALYGAGGEAGAAALQGEEITAEKVLSGAGRGALMGALLGGAGGVVAGKIQDTIGAYKAGAAERTDKLMAAKIDKLEDTLRKRGLSEEKIATKLERETERLQERGGALQGFAAKEAMRTLDVDAKLARSHAAKAGTSVDEMIAQAGQDYLGYKMKTGPLAGKRIFHGARLPVDAVDDVQHALQETATQVRHFEAMADKASLARPDLLPDAAPLQDRIFSDLKSGKKGAPSEFTRTVAADLAPVLTAPEKLSIGELRLATDAIEARIADTSSKAQLSQLNSIRRTLSDATADATENALMSSGVDAAQYLESKRVNQSLALVNDALAEMKLETASKSHESGLTGFALASALTGNFPSSLAAGASLVASHLLKSRAGGIVADVAHRVASSDVRLGWGAKALAGDAWKGTQRIAVNAERAEPLMRKVQEMTVSPTAAAQFAGNQVAPYAAQYPGLATAATAKLMGDLQYLASQIPAPVGRSAATLTPAAVTSFRTPREAANWMQRVAALEDPGIVIDQVLEGKIPKAAIETLKERRPKIWEEMRQQVMTETAARGQELPYKRRITLGLAFDFTSDKSLAPGMLRSIQATTVSLPAQPGPSPTTGAMQAGNNAADSMSLPSEVSL